MRGSRFGVLISVAALLAASMSGVLAPSVQANHGFGSFEVDGNTPDSQPGEPVDWATAASGTPPITVTPFEDAFGAGKEDGFGGHSANNDPARWACDEVSTPEKDDIKSGAIGFRTIGNDQFVYMNFTRVGNNGTADLDFEINAGGGQHPSPPCQPYLPARTFGDLVIAFDQRGQTSTEADVNLFRWEGDASTGQLVPVNTAGLFEGRLSSDRLFGEAVLNLSAALGGPVACGQFSTAFMKSRASTSINSDLKDRTDPENIALGNCPVSNLDKGVRIYNSGNLFVDNLTASPGNILEYQLTYTNTGQAPATNVVVTDTLQPFQTLVPNSCSPVCAVNGSTLTWTFPSVAPNTPQVMTFRVTLADTFPPGETVVTNQGAVDTNEETSKPSDTTRVTVNAAAVFSSSKSVTPNPQSVGQQVTYTVTVNNTGNAAGTTTVTDNYDQAHIDPLSISDSGQDNGDTIVWSNVPVPAHGSVVLTYTALVIGTFSGPSGGSPCSAGQFPVPNTVTLSSGTGSNATLCVIANPILTTDKTVSPTSANVGGTVTYSIRINNTGNAAGTTTVTDNYDQAHIDPQVISNSGFDNGDTIVWSNVSVPAQGSVTLTYTALVTGTFSGTPGPGCGPGQFPVINTVTITGGTGDTNTLCVNAAPVLTTDKTVSPTSANVGGTVTYSIQINNTGNAAGTTTVTDNYDQAHIDPQVISNSGLDNGDTIVWSNVSVPAQGSVTLTYTALVTGTFSGTPGPGCGPGQFPVINTVTITGGTGDTNTLCVNATAILRSEKTVAPIAASVGETVTYTVRVINSGNAAGTTTVTDDYDQAHIDPLVISNSGQDNGDTIVWSNLAVPAQTTVTLTYTARVIGSFSGTPGPGCSPGQFPVINNVTITGGTGSSATLCVNAVAVLTTDKTVTPTSASLGDTVTYSIRITNTGDAAGTTTVTDNYDQAHIDPLVISNNGADNGDTIVWSNVAVPAKGSVTLTYTARIIGSFTGTPPTGCGPGQFPVLNQVTITGGSGDTNTLCVNVPPILTISKTPCPTTAVPGGILTYTIDFANIGASTATGVQVVDTIPTGTEVAHAGGGTVSPDGRTVTWSIGSLFPGQTGSRTLQVLVNASSGAILTNTATITATNAASATTGAVVTPVSDAGALTKGTAYGADANVLGLDLIRQLGRVDSQAPGSPGHADRQLVNISVPTLVQLGVITNTSDSSLAKNQASSTATSQVAGVNLLAGAIQADVVRGVSTSTADANFATSNSAGSTFANLRINGTSITNVKPNTTIDVKNPLLPIQTLARAVLYEESKTATFANNKFTSTHSVNMISVTLLQPFLTLPAGAKIIVAHANTEATYPSGLACGTRPGLVSGNAYNAYVNGTLFGNQFANVQVGDASITPLGGSDSDGVAAFIPGVITNATVTNTASGSIAGHPTATARSRAEQVNVLGGLYPGGLVTADVLDVKSTSVTTANTATTTFATTFLNLRVAGVRVNAAVNGSIYVGLGGGSFAIVILNEQVASNGVKDTFGTINAVHVLVYNALGIVTAEVIVAHAHSDAHHP